MALSIAIAVRWFGYHVHDGWELCRTFAEVGSLFSTILAVLSLVGRPKYIPVLQTGELSVPQHPLGLGFNEIEVTYTAGFAPVPDAVKCACAQIARNAQATPALNVRASGIERMQMEYFADSLLDQSIRELLAPYVAQKVA